jgi:hypothetical protein
MSLAVTSSQDSSQGLVSISPAAYAAFVPLGFLAFALTAAS